MVVSGRIRRRPATRPTRDEPEPPHGEERERAVPRPPASRCSRGVRRTVRARPRAPRRTHPFRPEWSPTCRRATERPGDPHGSRDERHVFRPPSNCSDPPTGTPSALPSPTCDSSAGPLHGAIGRPTCPRIPRKGKTGATSSISEARTSTTVHPAVVTMTGLRSSCCSSGTAAASMLTRCTRSATWSTGSGSLLGSRGAAAPAEDRRWPVSRRRR